MATLWYVRTSTPRIWTFYFAKLAFLPRHMTRKMPPTHPCMAEATMTRRPIGVVATLAFSRLVVPLAADGQWPGEIPVIGILHPVRLFVLSHIRYRSVMDHASSGRGHRNRRWAGQTGPRVDRKSVV